MNRWLVFLSLGLFCSGKILSQNTDGFLRINPTISYKFNKNWKTELDYRFTLDNNMTRFRSSHIQLSTAYKIIKPLSIELGYRYTATPQWNPHRIMVSVSYRHKFEHFSLSARTRYQFSTVYFDPYFINQVQAPGQYFRQKIGIDYTIPNTTVSVFASSEIFFRMRYSTLEWHRMRYQIGVEKELKFGNTIGMRIIYEDRANPNSQDRIIVTAKYDLSIDTMIKKIKKKKAKKEAKAQSNPESTAPVIE